jgi:hypothetical protein
LLKVKIAVENVHQVKDPKFVISNGP